ncbi:sulfatase family protein [Paenibacillus nasutitermitis]|uniref:Sulfatase n=1 Tax=Paenibacillus nasutitermitis TaxID=1652958 RepID=A0A916Z255_9BACL|nr:sulfatase-like hydrolase/transferase [Paenibacillus nasutitermitis]GGD72442.1 sulfatase [Paenibacillus nasutitermitis]
MDTKQPNIILITTDQQRYDSIKANGSSFMNTPHMDRLAKEGVSFRRAYCPNTICTPSRVSIMSGMHLSRHGSYNIGTTTSHYSTWISTILREHGYRTHHVGKAHWHPWGSESPETMEVDDRGTPFYDFSGFETAELSLGHNTYGVTSHYAHWVNQKGFDPKSFANSRMFDEDANDTGDWNIPLEVHQGNWIAESAIDFMKSQEGDRPFFLNLGIQDPHHPHVLPVQFTNRVDPAAIPLPDNTNDTETDYADHIPLFHNGRIVESRFNGPHVIAGNGAVAWKTYFEDEEKTRLTRAYYYSMVQLIDEQLGRILDALDSLGLADDTLIIFTSDHGEMLGDHRIGQKGPLVYEGVTHIPLLVRYPNGFAPCEVEEVVSLVDLLPTILDFAAIEDHVKRDGISLKPRLADGELLSRSGVRIEYKEEPDRIRYKCWVKAEWKLAVYLGEIFGELYHLQEDPGEKHNLFHLPEYQSIKLELMMELLNDMERSEPVNRRSSRV